ncbi:MAG: DUF1801 domain-containing protein [Bacteroidia bacterium]
MDASIADYNAQQTPEEHYICNILAQEIIAQLPDATYKIWHRHPVWFLDGNPVVGYSKRKVGINLMFWSGQSFDEPDLKNEGSFKAAEIRYTEAAQIQLPDLHRWLAKSRSIQWDYKNIVKRKGVLERLS